MQAIPFFTGNSGSGLTFGLMSRSGDDITFATGSLGAQRNLLFEDGVSLKYITLTKRL